MLRACRRVLRPGGRLAFGVISVRPGAPEDVKGDAEKGRAWFVDTPRPYRELLHEAGFTDVLEHDVTGDYRRILAAWIRETERLEPELRGVLGDEVVDQKMNDRRSSLAAVDAGVYARAVFSASAPVH